MRKAVRPVHESPSAYNCLYYMQHRDRFAFLLHIFLREITPRRNSP
ncbi:hypothetical protein HMPREF0580_1329 [Mobiluncus mulieris ATCC 35239]|uniref:Uncharacterized protein n=1 Tax=Mobiluncus mulieris ATCC 35239 TaxID=871571 RepID=E0QR14_9ACTO|nr:hypothetical protein HMPREF0580_1329 [Mobiluncus mulieris ATCC 35239]